MWYVDNNWIFISTCNTEILLDLQTEVLAQRAEIRQLTKAITTLTTFVKQSMRSIKTNNVTQNCDDDFPINSEEELLEVDGKISRDPTSYVGFQSMPWNKNIFSY